jgi:membrane-bound metal-dependent hydrolase YbcI (DUF457 family)
MFIGHFAVGLAARPLAPRVSLPVLLAAPQFLDMLWPIFVCVGIERVRIVPGLLAASPLALDHMPWSHSLAVVAVWAVLFAGVYRRFTGDRRGATVCAGLVLSHWVLDAVAHRPDMALYPGGPEVGLGLWRSVPGTLVVELALYAAGVVLYTRASRARDRTGSIAWWALVVTLLLIEIGSVLGPPPPDVTGLMVTSFAGWSFLLWAWWIERHRAPVFDAGAP